MDTHPRSVADLARIVATACRATRQAIGWSQRELADRAGVSQATISRVEACEATAMSPPVIGRLSEAMGLRITLTTDAPPFVSRRQRDSVHAQCVGYICRRLAALGWLTEVEVEIGQGRSLGWIDILAYHAPTRSLLVIEVKTELHDAGGLLRTMSWYQRSAWSVARARGWRPATVSSAVIFLASTANDDAISANRDVLRSGYPDDARDLSRLVSGELGRVNSLRAIAMVDPCSRRRDWLWRTKVDGRRSEPPVADYAGQVRRMRSRTVANRFAVKRSYPLMGRPRHGPA